MNKILLVAAIVALVTTLSFAQEGDLKVGIRAGFNLYDLSSGNKELDKELDLGMGFGGGIAVNIPLLGSFLSLSPELNFYYRKLLSFSDSWNDDYYSGSEDVYVSEFALSVPVMLQIAPIDAFYLAAGVQLDMPFSTKGHYEYEEKNIINGETDSGSENEKIKDRASIDFGIALGLGYNITQNFRADLRCVIGLTSTGIFTDYDEEYVDGEYREVKMEDTKSSFNQYGLGLTYFF